MSAKHVINKNRMSRNQGGGSSAMRGGQGYSMGGGNVHYVRTDIVTRKREERNIREAYRREKKMSSYLAEDENFPNFRNQLAKIGLELRDIPGDGNCLFRALGDQYEGHVRNHFKHRQDVVRFMLDHKENFEPFIADDDISFEKHIAGLQKMGTYAGNDAIVAFARLHQVNIIIHQLNSPFLLIPGPDVCSPTTRQLHIAYHNGDHYSSVRKTCDNTESPTNIRLKIADSDVPTGYKEFPGHAVGEDGIVRALRDTDRLTEEVMIATGCTNPTRVMECLCDCDYDVDAAIAYLLQTMETMNGYCEDTNSLASQMTSTDSGIWSENGATPTRGSQHAEKSGVDVNHNVKGHFREDSYGGSSGYGSVKGQPNGGARPKDNPQVNGAPEPKAAPVKVSSKQTKKMKKQEKKKRAEEKHKMKFLGLEPRVVDDDNDDVVTIVSRDLQMARI